MIAHLYQKVIFILSIFLLHCTLETTIQSFDFMSDVNKSSYLTIKGKYPIGLFAVDIHSFSEIESTGFNFVHIYDSQQSLDDAQNYLDKSNQYGLTVMQNMPSAYLERDSSYWINWINELKKYESMGLWYLPEEEQAKKLSKLSDLIKIHDEHNHLTATYLPWNSELTLAKYTDILDILIIGSYPEYYHEPRANVMTWIINGLNLYPQIPYVFSAIPAFDLGDGWPSPKAVRCDAYTSIITGAHGIVWYSFERARKNSELWLMMKKVANEINGEGNLSPIILSKEEEKSINSVILSGPRATPFTYIWDQGKRKDVNRAFNSIQWRAKIHEDHVYILAVNLAQIYPGRSGYSDATVTAKFKNLPCKEGFAEVLFENRKVEIKDFSFADIFTELQVHIYKVKSTTRNIPHH